MSNNWGKILKDVTHSAWLVLQGKRRRKQSQEILEVIMAKNLFKLNYRNQTTDPET